MTEPDEPRDLYDVARRVTDEAFGEGAWEDPRQDAAWRERLLDLAVEQLATEVSELTRAGAPFGPFPDGSPMPLGLYRNAEAFERVRSDPLNWVVGRTPVGNCTVSTVWLGIDHSFGARAPELFETMIFHRDGGMADDAVWRYPDWDSALLGHHAVVAYLVTRLALPAGSPWIEGSNAVE